MTFKEIIDADLAKWEQQQEHRPIEAIHEELAPQYSNEPRDERVKTDIDSWRNRAIGEIVVKHFPELQCFHPQLHKFANAEEFRLFDDFLTEVATNKSIRTAMQKMVADKTAESKTGGP